MIIAKLKKLKEEKHMTTQQIADLSGVPASTISRILSGQTDNPSIQTISDLVYAMGGSLDEIMGRSEPKQPEEHHAAPTNHDCLHAEKQHCCTIVAMYEREIEHKNQWIRRMFITCAILIAMLVIVALLEILCGDRGIIRY